MRCSAPSSICGRPSIFPTAITRNGTAPATRVDQKGAQIPLSARILAVADVWDALHSSRPYRRALPEEQVRAHICEQAGRHFDPAVVDAFLTLEDHNER